MAALCVMPGCYEPLYVRQVCRTHYRKLRSETGHKTKMAEARVASLSRKISEWEREHSQNIFAGADRVRAALEADERRRISAIETYQRMARRLLEKARECPCKDPAATLMRKEAKALGQSARAMQKMVAPPCIGCIWAPVCKRLDMTCGVFRLYTEGRSGNRGVKPHKFPDLSWNEWRTQQIADERAQGHGKKLVSAS